MLKPARSKGDTRYESWQHRDDYALRAELEVGPGGKLGRNRSCRARLTLKLRMRTARAALAQINSVCSALICRAGPSRSPVAAGTRAFRVCKRENERKSSNLLFSNEL